MVCGVYLYNPELSIGFIPESPEIQAIVTGIRATNYDAAYYLLKKRIAAEYCLLPVSRLTLLGVFFGEE